MGIFASIKKSKFIIHVVNKCADGDMPVDEILGFITKHKDLSKVAREFNTTRDDIENIINGMLASGAADSYRGHFSPISGVLFADTLAYLLRGQRGQVSKIDSYYEVNEYFRTGAMLFKPEVTFRKNQMRSFHENKGYAMGQKVKGFFAKG